MAANRVPEAVIGVDVGGSGVRAARVGADGAVIGPVVRVGLGDRSRNGVLGHVVELVTALTRHHPARAVGVGLPAFLRQPDGTVTLAPNLPDLNGWPAAAALRAAIDLPCVVENDADAAAFGEYWAGREKPDPFIYLGLGTGLGGGVVLGGQVLHGARGMAAELGHLTVWPEGARCGCGARGCVEAYASAVGIARAYHEATGESQTAEEIARRAHGGDPHARVAYTVAGRALGIAVAQLVHVFNPALVAIGGGIAQAWELFEPAMTAEVAARTPAAMRDGLQVRRAGLGADAGVIGAAGLAWRTLARA
ncbi:MAG: ROK family protein [Nitrospirae bacterium]|nr:ROK family protein [Nitrospirota bacterium]